MDRDLERLLAEALKLSPEARAKLVGSLIESLDQQVDVEAEWAVEIRRRIREFDDGRSKPITWREAKRITREA